MAKPMNKTLLYSIFILKFLFGLGLIAWTITITMSSDVGQDEDTSFLSSYHDVDRGFNDMIFSNNDFEKIYNIKFYLNDTIIDELTVKDVFLSQRAIKKRTIRKDILKVGDNTFKYKVTTKDGKEVKNAKVTMLVTMTTNHTYDKNLEFKNEQKEIFNVHIQSYWNITGTIEVDKHKGFYFIKTNSK